MSRHAAPDDPADRPPADREPRAWEPHDRPPHDREPDDRRSVDPERGGWTPSDPGPGEWEPGGRPGAEPGPPDWQGGGRRPVDPGPGNPYPAEPGQWAGAGGVPGDREPAEPVSGPYGADQAWKQHLTSAGLAAVVTPALAVAAHAGAVAVLVGVAVLQALLVVAWVFGTGLPGRVGGLLIGLGVAGAADAVLHLRDQMSLAGLLGVLGLTVPALLAHQLSRGVVRVRVTESMSGVAAVGTAGASAAAYLALYRAVDGGRLVSAAIGAAGVGLVVGRLIDIALPVPRLARDVPHGLLGVGASISLGAAVGAAHALGAPQLQIGNGALLGGCTAGVAALVAVGVTYLGEAAGAQTASVQTGRLRRPALAYLRVGLPLACAGPVAYLLGLWVGG